MPDPSPPLPPVTPPRLRDLVAKPRPFPLRTVVLVALVPLVAFTVFVIVTHHDAPPRPPLPPTASAPPAQPSNVIFVTPVGAAPASSR